MHEAGVEPDWVIGTSIGAINASLIAGNKPEHPLAKLEEFWNHVGQIPALEVAASRKGIRARWAAGYGNARRALADAPWAAAVDPIEGFYLHKCRPATAAMG